MIYPDVPLEQWLKKYPALTVLKEKCRKCGTEVSTDKPFITDDFVGIHVSPCSCGHESKIMSCFTRTKESLRKWRGI